MDQNHNGCPHPLAYSFKFWDCGDSTCGMHIVAFNSKEEVICEIVTSIDQTIHMADWIDEFLEYRCKQHGV